MEYAKPFTNPKGPKEFPMKQHSRPTRPISVFKPGQKSKDSLNEGPTGKLIVIFGDRLGKQYHLGRERMLIGRLGQSDILIDDSSVSREHAMIKGEMGDLFWRTLRAPMEPLSMGNSSMFASKITGIRFESEIPSCNSSWKDNTCGLLFSFPRLDVLGVTRRV
jgi:hypothetical protein